MSGMGDALVCPSCGWHMNSELDNALYLPAGYLLNNRYTIGKVIGVGGFGIVYIAWDNNLDIRVAVKEYLPKEYAARSANHVSITPYTGSAHEDFFLGLEKFLEEAKALAQFQDHPGIVTVHESFRTNDTAYMVMQYLDGITLKEYLNSQPGEKIAFNVAVKAMTPIMDALREVHNAGFVHRDISPDNIFITSRNHVKLLDFGSARYAIGEHSKSLTSVLKHGYAPVEQYSTKGKQGPWSDVYAVSATIYRCVTGFVPLDAMERIQEDTIKSPQQHGIDIPLSCERAIMRGLALKASDRFENIQQLQQSLAIEEMTIPTQQTAHDELIQPHRPQALSVIECPVCGEENQHHPGDDPNPLRCRKCQRELGVVSPIAVAAATDTSMITEQDFTAFIGKNADKYLTKFSKFHINGTDYFQVTWHWPAFFAPILWMIYRKLYLWASLAFVLSFIPYAYCIMMIVFGILGNYIYYKHTKKKLLEINKLLSPDARAAKIGRYGGANSIKALIFCATIVPVLGILAAIAISQLTANGRDADSIQEPAEPPNVEAPASISPAAEEWLKKAFALWNAKQGNFTEPRKAIKYLNEAIRLQPDSATAFLNRGNAYGDIEQQQRAIEDYDMAINLKPDFAEAHFNRGNAYHKLKRYERAIEDYDEAIRLQPDLARPHYNRGLAHMLSGNELEGCSSLSKACELGECKLYELARNNGYCQ